jgi:hypothetical protein
MLGSARRFNIMSHLLKFDRFRTMLSVLPLVAAQTACGMFGGSGNEPMLSSASVPAAQGTVQATAGENGNTKLEVRVKHLAPATTGASDASVYVVWVKSRDGEVQNAGALVVDDDLEGKLETTTPHRAFTLTVTPEPSARVGAPTHKPVFTSEVNRTD